MKIRKIVLQTFYLQVLKEFYSSILELPVHAESDREIMIHIGSSELVFIETKETEPFYHFAINIPANKIEEVKSWLSNKLRLLWIEEYKSEIADFINWHAKSVYFFDPAGNIVELIARLDLNNATSEPFSPTQLLSISEIGVVFSPEDFERKTTELLKLYSLAYFTRQSPLPQFRAIGDDEGLFIVVTANRNWYPTDKRALTFPMEVQIENNGKAYQLHL